LEAVQDKPIASHKTTSRLPPLEQVITKPLNWGSRWCVLQHQSSKATAFGLTFHEHPKRPFTHPTSYVIPPHWSATLQV